jgi:hypothetical protein
MLRPPEPASASLGKMIVAPLRPFHFNFGLAANRDLIRGNATASIPVKFGRPSINNSMEVICER